MGLGFLTLVLVAYLVSDNWARACEKDKLDACRAAQVARAPGPGTLVLPLGVSVQSGFPIVTADVHCSSGVMYDLDGDSKQEAIFGASQGPGTGNVQRSFDSVWAVKGDGKCLAKWPITIPSHVCSGPAVGDITSASSGVEVVFGSNQDPGDTQYQPDHRVYAVDKDGSPVSGFPKELGAGKVMGIPTLADIAGDSKLEILAGTAGYWTKNQLTGVVTQYSGKIVGLDGSGSYVSGWNKTLTNQIVINSAAVGDLYQDGQSYVGVEVVFVVTEYTNPTGMQIYPTYSQKIYVFQKDGTAMCSLDLDNDNNAERCHKVGFGASSPAIGKLKAYTDAKIKSNLVVLMEDRFIGSGDSTGKIKVYHIESVNNVLTLVEDYSKTASEQTATCTNDSSDEGKYYDTFVSSPCIADLDNDTHNEVVAFSRNGQLYVVYYNPGPPGSWVCRNKIVVTCASTETPCSNLKMGGPIAVDIDNDGDLEIIVSAFQPRAGGDPYIRVYDYDTTSPYIHDKFGIQLDSNVASTIFAGNMDADTKVEIVAPAYNFGGRVWAYEFDNSVYNSSAGWWCECGNAARTSCAD